MRGYLRLMGLLQQLFDLALGLYSAAVKKILDKLVSAKVVDKAKPPVVETHEPAEIETPAGKPDEEILSKLASGPELSEPTRTSEPCETEIPDTEEVRRDVLEQLTGSEEDQKKQNQAGADQGDTPDA